MSSSTARTQTSGKARQGRRCRQSTWPFGQGYCYQTLATARKDVTDVQLVPAFDAGHFAVATRVVERNASGNRGDPQTLQARWQPLCASLSGEVGKEQGKNKLSVKVDFSSRRAKPTSTNPKPAKGFSETTWKELPTRRHQAAAAAVAGQKGALRLKAANCKKTKVVARSAEPKRRGTASWDRHAVHAPIPRPLRHRFLVLGDQLDERCRRLRWHIK